MKHAVTTFVVAGFAALHPCAASPLQSARVTKVINEVRIFKTTSPVGPAVVGDVVSGRTSLQTGRRSRAELRFRDDTLTRLGANSIFSFHQGTRDLRLEQGTILLRVPRNAGGARIRTATITAAITGTTIMMEYFSKHWAKIIVLEGALTTWIEKDGHTARRDVRAGQMILLKADDAKMPPPVEIDVKRLLKTSALADPLLFGPLPGPALDRIDETVNRQESLINEGVLTHDRPGAPLGPVSSGSERTAQTRDTINDSAPPPVPPQREGDDPRQ